MKYFILFFVVAVLTLSSCKTKKNLSNKADSSASQISMADKTLGKVSHQFRSSGCATVILVGITGQESPMILIPKDTLPQSIDVDGTEIYFKYRKLKMPQPKGCSKGIPAEITDLIKK
ncbi:MAG TPA: hypothetical protein VII99_06560 [Bacteroidia bacterium]